MIDQEVLEIMSVDLREFCINFNRCDDCPFYNLVSVDDKHWYCHTEEFLNGTDILDLPADTIVESYNLLLEESPDDCRIKEWDVEKIVLPDDTENIARINGIMHDDINYPAHYTAGDIECIDALRAAFGKDAVADFCRCNAFKYLWRSPLKEPRKSIDKAIWYLNKYKELKGWQDV